MGTHDLKKNVTLLGLISALAALGASCGARPAKMMLDSSAAACPSFDGVAEKGLWLATSNDTTGGPLERLDLATCQLNPKLLELGADVALVPDGPTGLFLLNRLRTDEIVSLESDGKEVRVKAELPLPKTSNPQWAARDGEGRVWVTALNSNEVFVLSADLRQELGRVDLSILVEKDSPDKLAEMFQAVRVDDTHMLITAQRLRREPRSWTPEARAGYAVVKTTPSFTVESSGDLEVSNPVAAARDNNNDLLIVGSGFLNPTQGSNGGFLRFTTGKQPIQVTEKLTGRVVDASLHQKGQPPTMIVWYPELKRSCVQIGAQQVICEGSESDGGYVFHKVVRADQTLFVAYAAGGNSQLWIVPVNSKSAPVQKLNVGLPIRSMLLGP